MSFLAAHDGDSVIIVNEQKGKKQNSSRLVFVLVSVDILFFTLFYHKLHFTVVNSDAMSNMSKQALSKTYMSKLFISDVVNFNSSV